MTRAKELSEPDIVARVDERNLWKEHQLKTTFLGPDRGYATNFTCSVCGKKLVITDTPDPCPGKSAAG